MPRAETPAPARSLVTDLNRPTVLWSLAIGIGFALFMTSPVRDVYFNHFSSWEISDRPSTTTSARLWRGIGGPAVLVTFVGSILSGAIAFLHIRDDDSGPGAWVTAVARVGVSFILSIAIEWTTDGVQDGSSRDVDLVPTHSVVLLNLALASPWVFSAIDLTLHRRNTR